MQKFIIRQVKAMSKFYRVPNTHAAFSVSTDNNKVECLTIDFNLLPDEGRAARLKAIARQSIA